MYVCCRPSRCSYSSSAAAAVASAASALECRVVLDRTFGWIDCMLHGIIVPVVKLDPVFPWQIADDVKTEPKQIPNDAIIYYFRDSGIKLVAMSARGPRATAVVPSPHPPPPSILSFVPHIPPPPSFRLADRHVLRVCLAVIGCWRDQSGRRGGVGTEKSTSSAPSASGRDQLFSSLHACMLEQRRQMTATACTVGRCGDRCDVCVCVFVETILAPVYRSFGVYT